MRDLAGTNSKLYEDVIPESVRSDKKDPCRFQGRYIQELKFEKPTFQFPPDALLIM